MPSITRRDPELHNSDIEWFFCVADYSCGLRSITGAMIDTLFLQRARKAKTKSLESEVRQFTLKEQIAATLTLELGRAPSHNEVNLKLYFAERLGVGTIGVKSQAVDTTSDFSSYTSGQCDFEDTTNFAKLRRCSKRWRKLSEPARRTLAAYYLGMDPSWPADVRAAAHRAFGPFASVVLWSTDPNEKVADSAQRDVRANAENQVRSAHKEWKQE